MINAKCCQHRFWLWYENGKGQENPDFCASGLFGSFPYNPIVGSGTYGNRPVGPEILAFMQREVHTKSKNVSSRTFSLYDALLIAEC